MSASTDGIQSHTSAGQGRAFECSLEAQDTLAVAYVARDTLLTVETAVMARRSAPIVQRSEVDTSEMALVEAS